MVADIKSSPASEPEINCQKRRYWLGLKQGYMPDCGHNGSKMWEIEKSFVDKRNENAKDRRTSTNGNVRTSFFDGNHFLFDYYYIFYYIHISLYINIIYKIIYSDYIYCRIMDERSRGVCCVDYKQAVAEHIRSEAKIKDKELLGDNKRINSSTSSDVKECGLRWWESLINYLVVLIIIRLLRLVYV